MPELVTHTLAATFIRHSSRRQFPMLLFGAVLPDLLNRGVGTLLGWILKPELLAPEDIPISWYLTHFHTPIGLVVTIYGITLLFEESLRRSVFCWMGTGVVLHFALDGLQRTLPEGVGYFWLFPFTWYSETLGVFWPEDSLYGIPGFIALLLLWEWRLWRRKQLPQD